MGFALVGLAAGTQEGVSGVVIYMLIYVLTTLGVFACVLAMRRAGLQVENISDLAGLGRTNKGLAFVFSMLMFSLAGIPPLAGFFGKLFVFMAAVKAGLCGSSPSSASSPALWVPIIISASSRSSTSTNPHLPLTAWTAK